MKQSRKFTALFILIITFYLAGCSATREISHPTQSATKWVHKAAEYDALTSLVYRTAADHLDLAYQDSYWTASLQQEQDQEFQNLPPAVILDVDETALDNSPFQLRMIEQNSSFDIETWNKWVREVSAEAVPGALAFARYAAEKGIVVFYLTNREHQVEEPTRKNLEQQGFPIADSIDVLLTKNERPSWTSAKANRRAYIANRYRVLMIIGDDLNDFLSAKNISAANRDELVENHEDMWGKKWFILPNPVYGSWQDIEY